MKVGTRVRITRSGLTAYIDEEGTTPHPVIKVEHGDLGTVCGPHPITLLRRMGWVVVELDRRDGHPAFVLVMPTMVEEVEA